MFGVIGGSGLGRLELDNAMDVVMDTPYGKPSAPIKVGYLGKRETAFIPRFGVRHEYSPTDVPYLANIYAMKKLGVNQMVSVSAVGSLKNEIRPGQITFISQIIDLTRNRKSSFFTSPVIHIPMSEPTCKQVTWPYDPHSTYLCIEGNRFSTKAESELWRKWGADVIGMTAAPEAFLAREAGIHFGIIAQVTDFDCWRDSDVSVEMIKTNIAKLNEVTKVMIRAIVDKDVKYTCHCADDITSACITDNPQFSETERFIMERK